VAVGTCGGRNVSQKNLSMARWALLVQAEAVQRGLRGGERHNRSHLRRELFGLGLEVGKRVREGSLQNYPEYKRSIIYYTNKPRYELQQSRRERSTPVPVRSLSTAMM
jgi:hypothetical protein